MQVIPEAPSFQTAHYSTNLSLSLATSVSPNVAPLASLPVLLPLLFFFLNLYLSQLKTNFLSFWNFLLNFVLPSYYLTLWLC